MRTAASPQTADPVQVQSPHCPPDTDGSLLAEFADDEDATVAQPMTAARGAAVGIILGAAFWAAVLVFIIKR